MNIRLIFYICTLLTLTACESDQSTSESRKLDSKKSIETPSQQKEENQPTTLAPPVRDSEQDSVDHQMSIASPFLNIGCCLEEADREKSCCCDSVFEEYNKMIESDDLTVAELSMTDPILSDCRRLMPKKFDLLENPPTNEEPEDLF